MGKFFGIALVGLMIGAMLSLGGFASQNQTLAQAPKTWHVDDDLADYPAAGFTKIQDAVDIVNDENAITACCGNGCLSSRQLTIL